jgi:hypothetical protein
MDRHYSRTKDRLDSLAKRGFELVLLAVLPFVLSLAGCERAVNVEVFVVTRGGENMKLGLVEVGAHSQKRIGPRLSAFFQDWRKESRGLDGVAEKANMIARAASQSVAAAQDTVTVRERDRSLALASLAQVIEDAEQRVDRYVEDVQLKTSVSDVAIRSFKNKFGLGDFTYCEKTCLLNRFEETRKALAGEQWTGIPTLRDEVLKAITTADEADLKYQSAILEVGSAKTASARAMAELENVSAAAGDSLTIEHVFSQLPIPEASAKTDADGKCRLVLPRNDDWIVVAHAERAVGEDTEQYWWRVHLPNHPDGTMIVLSNDNLLKKVDPFVWMEK